MENKQEYHSPTLTRVVLRREQAVLSVCSTGTAAAANVSTITCIAAGGRLCRRYVPGGDSAATAS